MHLRSAANSSTRSNEETKHLRPQISARTAPAAMPGFRNTLPRRTSSTYDGSNALAKAAKHGSADTRRSTRIRGRVRCCKALSGVKATDEHRCTRISSKRFPTSLLCFQPRTTPAGPPPRSRRVRYPCASVFIRGLKSGQAAPVPPPQRARSGIGSPLRLRACVVNQAKGMSHRPAFAVLGGLGGLCVSTRVVRPRARRIPHQTERNQGCWVVVWVLAGGAPPLLAVLYGCLLVVAGWLVCLLLGLWALDSLGKPVS
jgi:hypothetical protein